MDADAEDVIFRIFPSKVYRPLHLRVLSLSNPVLPHPDRVGSYRASTLPLLIQFIQATADAHQVNLIPVISFPPIARGRVHRRDSPPAAQFVRLNSGAR